MHVAGLVGLVVDEVDVGIELRIGGARDSARQTERQLPGLADAIVQHEVGSHEIAVAGLVQLVLVALQRHAAVLQSQSGFHRQLSVEFRRVHSVGGRDILTVAQVVAQGY